MTVKELKHALAILPAIYNDTEVMMEEEGVAYPVLSIIAQDEFYPPKGVTVLCITGWVSLDTRGLVYRHDPGNDSDRAHDEMLRQ